MKRVTKKSPTFAMQPGDKLGDGAKKPVRTVRKTASKVSTDASMPSVVVSDTQWIVSYDLDGPPGWLAYLMDLHIQACVEESLNSQRKTLFLCTTKTIAQMLGLREEVPYQEMEQALQQLTGIVVTRETVSVDDQKTSCESTRGYRRYEAATERGRLGEPQEMTVRIRLLDALFDYRDECEVLPLDPEYRQGLQAGARTLYEWLSYRLYAAALKGCATAPICYSDFCRYAGQPRRTTGEEVRAQMDVLHQPHCESDYLAEVLYEPSPDRDGLPDWTLTYRGGTRAQQQFIEFRRKRIRAVMPATDFEAARSLTLPATAEASDTPEPEP
jgi:hypothetical protein